MFTESEVERTTAATDALLGLLCLVVAIQLIGIPTEVRWLRNVWVGVFSLMSCGSILGAVVHGVRMSDASRAAIWRPLYVAIGLAVALVVVAAAFDGWGEPAARRLMPWAIGTGLVSGVAIAFLGGAFLLFVVYEAVATVVALAIYGGLAGAGMPGAAAIAIGLAISLAAAAVQRTRLSVRLLVRFDHNGLFHLLQIAGVVAIAMGVHANLAAPYNATP